MSLDLDISDIEFTPDFEVLGEISLAERAALDSLPTPAPGQRITRIKTHHHEIARLLAAGERPGLVARATGYCVSRISILQADPAFKDLIEFYKGQRDVAHIDIAARISGLGLAAMDELQAKLESEPEKFSNKDLIEVMNSALDRTGFGVHTKSTNVNVSATAESLAQMKAKILSEHRGKIETRDQPASLGTAAGDILAGEYSEAEETSRPAGPGDLL